MQLSAPTTDFASLVSAVRGARKASPFPSREKFHLSRIPRTCPHERVPSERGDSARAKRRARRDFCGTFCSRRAHTHTHTHAVIAIGRLTNQRGERIAVPILHAVSPRVSRARASSFYRIGRPQGEGRGGESLHRVNRAHTVDPDFTVFRRYRSSPLPFSPLPAVSFAVLHRCRFSEPGPFRALLSILPPAYFTRTLGYVCSRWK